MRPSSGRGPSIALPPPVAATTSIQRLVEHQAAACGERLAIEAPGESVSYRELNQYANAVARQLMASGFRRAGYAVVRMPRGVELAAVLLGVLKAGGSYTWFDPSASAAWPEGISMRVCRRAGEDQFETVDIRRALGAGRAQPGPNLPIVTRGSDIACVLPDSNGTPAMLVPHATVVALAERRVRHTGRWDGAAGALDLWLGLMSGGTITVDHQSAHIAAA